MSCWCGCSQTGHAAAPAHPLSHRPGSLWESYGSCGTGRQSHHLERERFRKCEVFEVNIQTETWDELGFSMNQNLGCHQQSFGRRETLPASRSPNIFGALEQKIPHLLQWLPTPLRHWAFQGPCWTEHCKLPCLRARPQAKVELRNWCLNVSASGIIRTIPKTISQWIFRFSHVFFLAIGFYPQIWDYKPRFKLMFLPLIWNQPWVAPLLLAPQTTERDPGSCSISWHQGAGAKGLMLTC